MGESARECGLGRRAPLTETGPDGERGVQEQLLYINAKRLRGGLVFKAHRLSYHAALGSRVKKKQELIEDVRGREDVRERQGEREKVGERREGESQREREGERESEKERERARASERA